MEKRTLAHTKWDCKYHVVFIPKCRKKVLHGQLREHESFWARGYYVSTSGKDEEVIREYIRRQEKEDGEEDARQMELFRYQ